MDINKLTLKEKVGQMFMCGFNDEDHMNYLVKNLNVGGLIYFNKNVNDAKTTLELSNKIKTMSKVPLFISIDQEGGFITRIRKGITEVSGNMAIGATNNKKNAYVLSKIIADELSNLGINMNLAPVVDVNNNPNNPVINVRSYGEDPYKVTDFGLESLNAYKEKNMIAVAKHFPGHGDTNIDSHTSLPIIDYDELHLNNIELVPYKRMITEGLDAIMISHILFSKISNDGNPASLSYDIVTKLLKEQLGFEGLIITDCMEMKAILDNYGIEEAVVSSILAGNNIISISHSLELQKKAIEAVLHAIESGIIKESIIDNSVSKILKYKKKYNITNDIKSWEKIKDSINTFENNRLAKEISLNSITIVKDERKLIPLDKNNKNLLILPNIKAINKINELMYIEETDVIYYDLDLLDANIEEIANKSKYYDNIIFGIYDIQLYKKQNELLNSIENINCILIALKSPYDVINIQKDISTYICCYEPTKLAMNSLLKVLFGDQIAKGKLPVSLSGGVKYDRKAKN